MTCTSHLAGQGRAVTLIDGRIVCSCSAQYALECEAQWMLNKLDLRQRREQLAAVGGNRGAAARQRLEDAITAQWQRMRDAA